MSREIRGTLKELGIRDSYFVFVIYKRVLGLRIPVGLRRRKYETKHYFTVEEDKSLCITFTEVHRKVFETQIHTWDRLKNRELPRTGVYLVVDRGEYVEVDHTHYGRHPEYYPWSFKIYDSFEDYLVEIESND